MSDPVDKATKLIALSASDNLEEARTAAWSACKIIRESKLLVQERPEDTTGGWLQDIIATAAASAATDSSGGRKKIAHLSQGGGMTALCGMGIRHGEGHYRIDHWPHIVPAMKNCCPNCLKKLVANIR